MGFMDAMNQKFAEDNAKEEARREQERQNRANIANSGAKSSQFSEEDRQRLHKYSSRDEYARDTGNPFGYFTYEKERAALDEADARAREQETASNKQESALNQQKDRMQEQFKDETRRGLSDIVGNARKNANARGLLYSGLREGAEQKAFGQANSAVAQNQAKLNTATEDKIADWSNQSAQNQLDIGQQGQDFAAGAYKDALEQRRVQQGQMQDIGAGVGAIGGALKAKRDKENG